MLSFFIVARMLITAVGGGGDFRPHLLQSQKVGER